MAAVGFFLPPILRLPKEIREKIYVAVFANHEMYETCGFLCPSPRDSQLLRVNKTIYDEAAVILYRETSFNYSMGAMDNPEFLPPSKHRQHIRHISIPCPDYMAVNLQEYPCLRTLTISIPVFFRSARGSEAWFSVRYSDQMKQVLAFAKSMSKLEVSLEGVMMEMNKGRYLYTRKRTVLKEAECKLGREQVQKRVPADDTLMEEIQADADPTATGGSE